MISFSKKCSTSFLSLSLLLITTIKATTAIGNVTDPKKLNNLSRNTNDQKLFDIYQKVVNHSPVQKDFLTNQELDQLFYYTRTHRVARSENMPHYDPTNLIGFCFGRAMTAHLIARQMGLREDSIKKLFIIGYLNAPNAGVWRFHVTTLVKGPFNEYYAIDPNLDRPYHRMPISSWVRVTQALLDPSEKAFLYLTPATTVIPDLSDNSPVPQEDGSKVLHLSFDPETHPGFVPYVFKDHVKNEIHGIKVFAPKNSTSLNQYFDTLEPHQQKRFNLMSIKVNEEKHSYNEYFLHLLETFR